VNALLDASHHEVEIDNPSTAIFYSISSAQKGLTGVSLGNFLIKRVVDELKKECPSLTNFATLSPVPGFSTWLKRLAMQDDSELLTAEELETLKLATDKTFNELLDDTTWVSDEKVSDAMREPMQRVLAKYIVKEKRDNGNAANPVAQFHLSNGAIFERINWLGDLSEHGISQSFGMMINYLYDLSVIDKNHEQYIEHGDIAQSKQIQKYI